MNEPSQSPAMRLTALRSTEDGTIEAYDDAAQMWQPVMRCMASAQLDKKATADFILHVLKQHEQSATLIPQLIAALELCLESTSLSWAAEHDAEIVLARAKAMR